MVKFIWFAKYFFNVFAADLNLRKNVFQIDMPPSFLLWRINVLAEALDRWHNVTKKWLNNVQSTCTKVIYEGRGDITFITRVTSLYHKSHDWAQRTRNFKIHDTVLKVTKLSSCPDCDKQILDTLILWACRQTRYKQQNFKMNLTFKL